MREVISGNTILFKHIFSKRGQRYVLVQESSEAISLTMFSLTKARPVAWSGFSPRLKKPQKKRISQKTSKKRTKTGKKRISILNFSTKLDLFQI